MMTGAPHLLVFEPEHRGHPLEWMQHLIRCGSAAKPPIELTLAVAPELIADLSRTATEQGARAIRTIALPEAERAQCNHPSRPRAALARWRAMRRLLRLTGADHGHFLTIDFLSLPLALGLPIGRPVSGILFRPSVHYREMAGDRPSGRERLRDLRKHVLYGRMLRHPELTAVCSLDPYFVGYAARRYGDGGKVRWLPDPVPLRVVPDSVECGLAARFPPGRIAFLLFGVLTARKGILTLLDALDRLAPESASRVAVMAAGRVDPPIAGEVRRMTEALAGRIGAPWFHLEDRHLTAGEIEALVARADVVLAPYQRFVGSSGVLLWAADRGKPVLVQDYGLLGRLARDHGLGHAVDTARPAHLAAGIEALLRKGADHHAHPRGMLGFAGAHAYTAFAHEILACAIGVTAAQQTTPKAFVAAREA